MDLGPDSFTIIIGLIGIQVVLFVSMFAVLQRDAKEKAKLSKELFGLMKKIEGLTATRREQICRHYDQMLDNLAVRLPTTVAAEASSLIFETESKILSRLAEIEPDLNDAQSKRKMDDLIKTMEGLEATLVGLTSTAVKRVMLEGRRSLLKGREDDEDISAAA